MQLTFLHYLANRAGPLVWHLWYRALHTAIVDNGRGDCVAPLCDGRVHDLDCKYCAGDFCKACCEFIIVIAHNIAGEDNGKDGTR